MTSMPTASMDVEKHCPIRAMKIATHLLEKDQTQESVNHQSTKKTSEEQIQVIKHSRLFYIIFIYLILLKSPIHCRISSGCGLGRTNQQPWFLSWLLEEPR